MKIVFKYSWIYDGQFREGYKSLKGKSDYKYPSQKEIVKFKEGLEELWQKTGDKVLKELSNVTGLNWNEDKITCYIVGWSMPFSDPLTIPVFKDLLYAFDTLTHELIHQLFIQNNESGYDYWKYIHDNYKELPFNARIHIPVQAIHEEILTNLFDKKRLEKQIKILSLYKDYKIALEMVKREGYKNIIKELRERYKNL